MASNFTKNSKAAWESAWKPENIGSSLGAITSGLTSIVQSGVSNAEIKNTSGEEAFINTVENTQFGSGSFENLLADFSMTDLARTNYNASALRGLTPGQMVGNTLSGVASGAMSGAQIGGPWGAVAGGVIGLGGGLAGIFVGNEKARNKANELNRIAEEANKMYLNNFNNAVSNTQGAMFNNSLLNIAKDGGKIYIQPSKRGTFTAAAKQRGLGVQEFASKVLANPNNYSESMRKKAQFAKNAAGWQHEYGGPLYAFSGDFSNGITFINEGGTHSQNPFEGVQVGVDQNNVPNLVEEGEIIYNDYVFSNRLKPTKKQLEDNGLNSKYEDWTFAKIVEDLQKESANNPNDIISQNTLKDMMNIITNMQEEVRAKKNKKNNNKFPWGGLIDVVEEDIGPEESDALIESFWGAAKTPEQRLAVIELDPSNPYKKSKNLTNNFNWKSLGRYAPVVADASSLLYNIFSKPDYTNANAGLEAMQRVPTASFTPVGGKQDYTPIDRNYLLNKQLGASRAVSRDIQNNAVNAAQAMANLANLNYTTQTGIGDSLIQLDRENLARKMQAAQFNLGIDQYNTNQAMQAQQMNQQRAYNIAQAAANAGQLREAIDNQRSQAISQSISGLTEDLAGIGTEGTYTDWIDLLTKTDALKDVKKAAKSSNEGKNGGRLLTKKRR